MNRGLLTTLFAVPFALPVLGHARATPEDLANAVVRAERTGDAAQRLALLHPASRACITAGNRPYFDWIFSRRQRLASEGSATPRTRLEEIAGHPPVDPDGRSDYPVAPSHLLTLDFSPSGTRRISLVLAVVRDRAGWVEVLPCPRPGAVASAQRADADAAQQARRVRASIEAMSLALRGELEALARSGRRIDAMSRYRDATGADLRTAKDVVDQLVPR